MDSKLIYDVGVHNGDDTAYYLHKGYRVVGIEANPEAVTKLRERFAEPIDHGDLSLVDVGVADHAGTIDFYVCNEHSDWSSFNPDKASNGGATNHVVKVRTDTFDSILSKYGVPFFCKIDIEGNDRLCLGGIDPADKPRFLSMEMSHSRGDEDIRTLESLGYTRFKLISQVTFGPAIPSIEAITRNLPEQIRHYRLKVKSYERKFFGKAVDGDWAFNRGSSGSFGFETPGRWHTLEEALKIWRSLHLIDDKLHALGVGGDWYDIHATTH